MSGFIHDARRARPGDVIAFNGKRYQAVKCKWPAPDNCCEECPFKGDVCNELDFVTTCVFHDIVFKPAAIDAASKETK